MAINFRIFVHRNGENLHLKLIGDFDGTSAHELLSVLKRYCNRISRVFIHTSCLRDMHAFGRNVFQANLDVLNSQSVTLVFTGENASKLAPEKSMFSDLIISTVPLSSPRLLLLCSRACGSKVATFLRREFIVAFKGVLGCVCIFSAGHLHLYG